MYQCTHMSFYSLSLLWCQRNGKELLRNSIFFFPQIVEKLRRQWVRKRDGWNFTVVDGQRQSYVIVSNEIWRHRVFFLSFLITPNELSRKSFSMYFNLSLTRFQRWKISRRTIESFVFSFFTYITTIKYKAAIVFTCEWRHHVYFDFAYVCKLSTRR